jgi:hypothetical protein
MGGLVVGHFVPLVLSGAFDTGFKLQHSSYLHATAITALMPVSVIIETFTRSSSPLNTIETTRSEAILSSIVAVHELDHFCRLFS